MPETAAPQPTQSGPRYWRSLEEAAQSPAFRDWMEREFPVGASESDGVNRRHFMKIMAAGFAAAGVGATGCRRPESHILPYSRQPERIIPGVPVFYATSQPDAVDSVPLIVETHQARPTKIEGNEQYLPYAGATTAINQASILDLYDPDRATRHYHGTRTLTQAQGKDVLNSLHAKYAPTGGKGLALLLTSSSSPTRQRILSQLSTQFPRARFFQHDAVQRESAASASLPRAIPHFDKAARVLSIDADFVASEPGCLRSARAFARSRKVHSTDEAHRMSRLYCAESRFSLTGTMADHRLRLAACQMTALLARLTAEAVRQSGAASDLAAVLDDRATGLNVDDKWIAECVRDLLQHRGQSLVIAGSHLPAEAQLLCAYLNELLGAPGKTIDYIESTTASSWGNLSALSEAVHAGEVDTLFILGGNPVYDAPGQAAFASLLARVPELLRFGYSIDETSLAVIEKGGHHLTSLHYLESWGDGRTWDGTLVPVQPMILPLFDGFTEIEVLARLANLPETDPYALVYATFQSIYKGAEAPEQAFARFLQDGFLPGSEFPRQRYSISVRALQTSLGNADLSAPALDAQNLEVRFIPDAKLFDGRYANNGWLQELPDPMTKHAWDNAILISPKLAHHIGFDPKSGTFLPVSAKKTANFKRGNEMAPIATLTLNGQSLTGPIAIAPGLPDWTVIVPLGYGRTRGGRVADGCGFDAFPLLPHSSKPFAHKASLTRTGETYALANTQHHWSMEGRAIIREGNVEDFLENPRFAQEMGMESHAPANYGKKDEASVQYKATEQPQGNSLYKTPTFSDPLPNVGVWNTPEGREKWVKPQQWGMVIDLNNCTGCNACVIACQSENNIPIVGKEQLIRGREMHWIRLDRYFSSGDYNTNLSQIPEDPQTSLMPMACVHCENAPCEQVCPVNATVHDEQGLNTMAYNRCVGTRYCANNCPYKVRRFNFFDWNKREIGHFYEGPLGPNRYEAGKLEQLPTLQKNPDVTIRMRGVIEKCTYCVQRIEQAKIAQRVKAKDSADIQVPDGMIRTACQQACPSEAIVFGDISDASTAVSQVKGTDRDYAVLGYLNVRPRTTYLARLRNPNPLMPDYHPTPHSRLEYKKRSGSAGKEAHGSATETHPAAADAEAGHSAPGH